MTRIREEMIHGRGQLDLIVGGTPCQSFSLAGLRMAVPVMAWIGRRVDMVEAILKGTSEEESP